jgi:hypothetical protein
VDPPDGLASLVLALGLALCEPLGVRVAREDALAEGLWFVAADDVIGILVDEEPHAWRSGDVER